MFRECHSGISIKGYIFVANFNDGIFSQIRPFMEYQNVVKAIGVNQICAQIVKQSIS